MIITPLEIENHDFQKKMRGFDPEEVRTFLALVAEEFEKLVVGNGKLQEEIGGLREKLGELRDRERMLKETMLTAQRLSHEMKEEAQRTREVIIKEGELRAEQMMGHARQRVTDMESEILDLKMERETVQSGLRSMLEQHLRLIELRDQQQAVASRVTPMRLKAAASPGVSSPADGPISAEITGAE